MAESLALRVKRLISGSVNDLVDALENANSESVMREAIRELDRTADEIRSEAGKLAATRHQTARNLERTKAKLAELAERVAIAIDHGRDDLAQVAIARQLDLEAQVPVLEKAIAELTDKQAELDGYLAAVKGRKSEMETDLAAFLEARTAAVGASGPGAAGKPGVIDLAERRVENAQSAFDRALGGNNPVQARTDRETTAKLIELERLGRNSAIAQRLAAAKAAREQR